MNEDTYIIIPVYNEGKVVRSVINQVEKHFSNIICVNDGSIDNSEKEILKTSAICVSHPINLGAGAAMQTGLEYALKDSKAHVFVTFDSDGQHQIEDVESMIKILKDNELDIVLGSRFLGRAKNIPLTKKILLKLAIKFSNMTSGVKLTDAHNGLRVFNRHVAENLKLIQADFSHATEIIDRITEKDFKYKEVPVTIIYTEYSKSKGQPLSNAINMGFDTLFKRISK